MLCNACNEDVHPYGQFMFGKGTQYRCPKCNGGMPKPEEDIVTTSGKDVIDAAPRVPQAPPSPVAQPVTVAEAKSPVEHMDVLAMAKARLAMVDEHIETLRALESEQALLRRMIEAAEPTAPVIPLRAKQG